MTTRSWTGDAPACKVRGHAWKRCFTHGVLFVCTRCARLGTGPNK